MNKSQYYLIIAFLTAIFIAILICCSLKSNIGVLYYSRGTVVPNKKYIESSIIQVKSGKIKGKICILDDKDVLVGKTIKIIRREFPNNFCFAEDCSDGTNKATIVSFKVVPYWWLWERAEITEIGN